MTGFLFLTSLTYEFYKDIPYLKSRFIKVEELKVDLEHSKSVNRFSPTKEREVGGDEIWAQSR